MLHQLHDFPQSPVHKLNIQIYIVLRKSAPSRRGDRTACNHVYFVYDSIYYSGLKPSSVGLNWAVRQGFYGLKPSSVGLAIGRSGGGARFFLCLISSRVAVGILINLWFETLKCRPLAVVPGFFHHSLTIFTDFKHLAVLKDCFP